MAPKQPSKSNPQPAKSNPQPATRSNNPPPKTQEEKKVQQVNQLVKEGKITKNEGSDLKDQIRESANKDGQISNKESKEINRQIEKDKKDRGDGKDDKPRGGDGGKGDGGKGDGGKGDGGKGGGKPPGQGGGGGGGTPPVLDDNKFNQKDIDAILKLINELQKDVKKLQDENKSLKNELDSLSDLAADGGGGGGAGTEDTVDDDAASAAADVPTTRSATGTIDVNIPKTNFGADISYPKDAERIWMPNIDKKVKKEVDRITMSLIKSTREFLEAGIDYDGINQVPATAGFQDDLLYTDPLENNQSEPSESALASEILLSVSNLLNEEFAKSDPNSVSYNYIRFLEFFELNYNAAGEPYYDLNININNDIIESLKAIIVKVDEDGIETRVAEGA